MRTLCCSVGRSPVVLADKTGLSLGLLNAGDWSVWEGVCGWMADCACDGGISGAGHAGAIDSAIDSAIDVVLTQGYSHDKIAEHVSAMPAKLDRWTGGRPAIRAFRKLGLRNPSNAVHGFRGRRYLPWSWRRPRW